MRKRALLVVVAAAALLAPVTAQARAEKTQTIKVWSISVGAPKRVDKPPKGTSKGDTIVFKDNLLNAAAQYGKATNAKVGTDRGTMTFTAKNAAVFKGSATLPGGTLTLDGPVLAAPDGKSIVIPVTGGTGRYKGAHGSVLVGPGTKKALNTYSLTYPTAPVA